MKVWPPFVARLIDLLAFYRPGFYREIYFVTHFSVQDDDDDDDVSFFEWPGSNRNILGGPACYVVLYVDIFC